MSLQDNFTGTDPIKGAYLSWEDDSGQSYSMGFDAVMSEVHEKTATLTEHPVEKGSDITDHVQVSLDHLTLEVMVTQTPINGVDIFGNSVGATQGKQLEVEQYTPTGLALVGGGGLMRAVSNLFSTPQYNAMVLQFSSPQAPMKAAQTKLWELIDKATLITIYTATRTYKNMILVNAPVSRDPGKGQCVNIQLEFKQIQVVESSLALIPAIPRAVPAVNKGKKNPKDTEKVEEVSVSRWVAEVTGGAAALGLPSL